MAVALDVGASRPALAEWGRFREWGRFMGDVPEPGKWQELRVPIHWLEVGDRPLRSLTITIASGQIQIDRVALRRGDRDVAVLLDDDVAQPAASAAELPWSEQNPHSGRRCLKLGPAEGDDKGPLEVAVTFPAPGYVNHLPFDVEAAVSALRAGIADLGETSAAERFREVLEALAPPPPESEDQ
jgi:hypothetical protein